MQCGALVMLLSQRYIPNRSILLFILENYFQILEQKNPNPQLLLAPTESKNVLLDVEHFLYMYVDMNTCR